MNIKDIDFSIPSAAERIMVAEERWESVHDDVQAAPLSDADVAELDRRLADLQSGKVQGIHWQSFRETLQTRR